MTLVRAPEPELNQNPIIQNEGIFQINEEIPVVNPVEQEEASSPWG